MSGVVGLGEDGKRKEKSLRLPVSPTEEVNTLKFSILKYGDKIPKNFKKKKAKEQFQICSDT